MAELEQSEVLVEKPDLDSSSLIEPKKESQTVPLSRTNASKLHRIIAILQHKDRLAKTNAFLTSSADMNISIVGYPALLLSGIFNQLGNPKFRMLLAYIAQQVPEPLEPLTQFLYKDPRKFAKRLRTLYSLLSDVRTFIRVWRSLDYLEWAVASLSAPADEGDAVLRYVDYGQLAACTVYQMLENVAYLASHNVIAATSKTQARLWSWSCIGWAVHVQLEFVKLYRQRQLAHGKLDQAWVRRLLVNCAYVPLSIHWSLEQGFLSDLAVGALGTFTVYNNARPKWEALLA